MIRTLLFTAALVAAAPAAAQTLTPAETAQVDAIVAKNLASTGVPSASVAIVRGGRIVFAKAYGKQSDTMPVARVDAPYQIASVSKQFTAAAILLLRDEGKLSLDDTVSKWLPGISGGDRITIRELLSHTSGLQDYWPQDYSFAAMAHPVDPQQIVDRWAKKPLDYPPGTQWQYSNTGYVVAGLIVEKAAGMPLLEFLQRRIFRPLGIKAMDQDLAVGPAYPSGYHRNALGPVRVAAPPAHGWLFAAGELAMSPTDLAKWDVARLDRSVLPAQDWAEQESSIKLADGKDSHYGLGVTLGEENGHRTINHGGEAVGFLTNNTVFPDDKAAIVVAVNADFGRAQDLIERDIAKVILPPKPASGGDAAADAAARAFYDGLRAGHIDRSRLTENDAYYFNAETLRDYQTSLAPLGEPAAFTALGGPRLRGGFVNRNYAITYPNGRKLLAVTYAEPGANGRWEQFLVMPAE